ncbi:MAG: hypothetical protein OER86_02085 [Phycisphaerae bacterium]|nr:hypothetical protein [Phycisphaerae bacterium]
MLKPIAGLSIRGGLMLLAAISAGPVVFAEGADQPIAIEAVQLGRPVDFVIDILPIFKSNCLACHNARKAKGKLVLEYPAAILKGGNEGPAINLKDPGSSYLLTLSAHREEPPMPPPRNKVGADALTPKQLGLLQRWIEEGAKGPARTVLAAPKWEPPPPGWNTIYAVAMTPDGRYVASGRANRIHLYQVSPSRDLGRLADPALSAGPVAHRDAVQSLAFSPDGQWLASGGYRSIKLWRREVRSQQVALPVDGSKISARAMSQDGARLAVALEDHGIRVIDVATGAVQATLDGHTAAVGALSFSADGRQLVSGSADKTLRIWSVAQSKIIRQIASPTEVRAVAWVGADPVVASSGPDKKIHLWPAGAAEDDAAGAEGGPKRSFDAGGEIVSLRSVPGEGNRLLSVSSTGEIRAWDSANGRVQRSFSVGAPVTALAISPDGRRLAASGRNRQSRLWQISDGRQLAELKTDGPTRVAEKKASAHLAFARNENRYQVETVKKREQTLGKEKAEVKKATDALPAADKVVTEKKQAMEKAVAEREQKIRDLAEAKETLEKAKAEQVQAPKDIEAANMAVAAAGKEVERLKAALAAANAAAKKAADDTARQQTAQARQKVEQALAEASRKQSEAKQGVGRANKARQDADRRAADVDRKLKDIQKRHKEAVDKASGAEQAVKVAERNRKSAQRRVEATKAAWARAEQALKAAQAAREAASSDEKRAEETGKKLTQAVAASQQDIGAITFLADGSVLVLGGGDGRAYLFNGEKGQSIGSLPLHAKAVTTLAAAGEGTIVSVGLDGQVRRGGIVPSWKLARELKPGTKDAAPVGRVSALAFSPDGRVLASGGGVASREGELVLWNVAEGRLIRSFPDAHSDSLSDLRFSFDGDRLASASTDRFVKIFDPANGELLQVLEGHTDHVLSVDWNRTGRSLATAGADQVVKVWDYESGRQKKTIGGFGKQVTLVRYLGYLDQFALSRGEGQASVYNEGGGQVRGFGGSSDYLHALATSGDGRLIVAGGEDGVLRVWDAGNGRVVAQFESTAGNE